MFDSIRFISIFFLISHILLKKIGEKDVCLYIYIKLIAKCILMFLFSPYFFKIVVVGDSGIGKSSLLLRYVDSTFFEEHIATIGGQISLIIDSNVYI